MSQTENCRFSRRDWVPHTCC